jgi:zinc transport system substrate-binding protein
MAKHGRGPGAAGRHPLGAAERRQPGLWIAALLPGLLLGLLLGGAPARGEPRLAVFVTLPPQKYFVERIAGERVEVTVLVPPGADAHTYEPHPRQMAALERARLYFAVGDPFEAVWLPKFRAANPRLRVVRTDAGVDKLPSGPEPGAHDPGRGQAPPDPHIWLSPALVRIQAGQILEGLTQADPAHRDDYAAGYTRFLRELDALDAELRALFRDLGAAREFMVFHPAWGYFARDYGLVQVAIEAQGKSPTPRRLRELIEHAKERKINVIFAQPQRSAKAAETIARAIGGRVEIADDLASDWADNLLAVAGKVRAALR